MLEAGFSTRVMVAALLASATLLAGCAGTQTRDDQAAPAEESPASPELTGQSPMRDLSLNSETLPDVLVRAVANPYARPKPQSCQLLAAEVSALNQVLGEDIDGEQREPTDDDLVLRALASGVESLIPYFGWIRRLSGANRRERIVLAAIAAGKTRRGYLKGLGEAAGCLPPAAPKQRRVAGG